MLRKPVSSKCAVIIWFLFIFLIVDHARRSINNWRVHHLYCYMKLRFYLEWTEKALFFLSSFMVYYKLRPSIFKEKYPQFVQSETLMFHFQSEINGITSTMPHESPTAIKYMNNNSNSLTDHTYIIHTATCRSNLWMNFFFILLNSRYYKLRSKFILCRKIILHHCIWKLLINYWKPVLKIMAKPEDHKKKSVNCSGFTWLFSVDGCVPYWKMFTVQTKCK